MANLRAGHPLGKPLYLAKRHIIDSTTVVELVMTEEPKRAGIDPYFKLIDRTPANNVILILKRGPTR